jgi:hypothetical protein
MRKCALLVLEDGRLFHGEAFGSVGEVSQGACGRGWGGGRCA